MKTDICAETGVSTLILLFPRQEEERETLTMIQEDAGELRLEVDNCKIAPGMHRNYRKLGLSAVRLGF